MTGSTRFDIAVIGRGMIGSAAARHLAQAGRSVALVGTGESADYNNSDVPFASHYDEGRITRVSAANPVWAELASRSIRRYTDIAASSGINFHTPTGLVQASLDADASIESALSRGAQARIVDHDWVRETTSIVMPSGPRVRLFYEDPPAGVISPRRLVAAQTSLAAHAGAVLIDAAATRINRGRAGFEISTAASDIEADQLIIATGAYGASLLGIELAIERRLRTVVVVELEDVAPLPCLILERPEQVAFERLYWTPPVPYPDGRVMLKVGGSATALEVADDVADIESWFRSGGSTTEAAALLHSLGDLLPDAHIVSSDHKPCVMTYTPNELPFVGQVDDGIVVALGGNGSAAKSSDEIGRLATTLLSNGGWVDEDIEAASLAPVVLGC